MKNQLLSNNDFIKFKKSCYYSNFSMNSPLSPVLKYLLYFAIFTTSFDIFLVINIGFNFRISQIALIPVIFYTIITRCNGRLSVLPIGYKLLLTWVLFIMFFIPNTSFPTRGFGYLFWLLFNILLIFSMVQLIKTERLLSDILKCYVYSFAFVALFGLVQFITPLIGLGGILVQQWWFPGILARINGFSYEPSFFSTYLLIGWVFIACLLKYKVFLIPKKRLSYIYLLVSVAMVLSTSRMGWMMMLIWYLQYFLFFIVKLYHGRINTKLFKYILLFVFIMIILIFLVIYAIGFDNISFLFAGLGIAGGSSHSSDTRTNEFIDTLTIFTQSPIIGYSLGGISSAIGNLRGIDVTDFEVAKMNEGMNVFAEVLAASGAFGFLFFISYFVKLVYLPITLAKKVTNVFHSTILKSLVVSFLFELLILQFNQNILRPYLWMHIAILCCAYSVIKSSYLKERCKATT